MKENEFVSPPMDEQMETVDEGPAVEGMTVEDAYRHLAGMPLEPVDVEAEE